MPLQFSIAVALLPCRRWGFGATASVRGMIDAAPKPSIASGGAAATGVVPSLLTPAVAVEEPKESTEP
jgi:hypothetical protein